MRISDSTMFHGRIEECLELTQNPKHWLEWHEGLDRIDMMRGHGERGSHIEGDYCLLNHHFPVSIDVEQASSDKWISKVHGPFELTYIYNIARISDEIELTAEIQGELRDTLLTGVEDPMMIERNLETQLVHSLDNIKYLMESNYWHQ